MQLLMSPASPFVRKVRVMLREANLMDVVQEVEVATTPMNSAPEVVAANPLGKIPVLLREDGPAIYDSRVITRYLDSHANSGLYPKSRLWDVLTLEATAEAAMDAAVGMTYEMRFRSEDMQYGDWLDAQWDKITRALGALDDTWLPVLKGPMTMGHIGTASALGYLDLRHDARGWRTNAPALADWYAEFAQRTSMVETAPE